MIKRLDGQEINFPYATRIIRDFDCDVEYAQGTRIDITALRKAETERRSHETHLRLSEKLESIGRLAAAISHEINTSIQYVSNNVHSINRLFEALCNAKPGEDKQAGASATPDSGNLQEILHDMHAREPAKRSQLLPALSAPTRRRSHQHGHLGRFEPQLSRACFDLPQNDSQLDRLAHRPACMSTLNLSAGTDGFSCSCASFLLLYIFPLCYGTLTSNFYVGYYHVPLLAIRFVMRRVHTVSAQDLPREW